MRSAARSTSRTSGAAGHGADNGAESGAMLGHVLQVLRPLVRLLLHHGIHHKVLATALKRLFLEEAERELQRRGMAATDSALTLLSGVHRRDVRTLKQGAAAGERGLRGVHGAAPPAMAMPRSLAAEVVGRWMHERRYLDKKGHPRALPRGAGEPGGFDALVHSLSRDVRPRAVLDELVRLGVAEEGTEGVRLLAEGFAPRRGLDEMASLFAANLHDHAAAAVANLRGEANHLEQAIFVDDITEESVRHLQQAGVAAWKVAMRDVMGQAQARFDADRTRPSAERTRRARFGVYFFSEKQE
jgi:Family of unknown function (DUF6502)